jgi:cell division protein FtsB
METSTRKPVIRKLHQSTSPQAVLPKTTAKPLWRKISLVQTGIIMVLAIALVLFVDLGRRAAANYRVQREAEQLTQQVALAHQHRAELLARRSYVASDLFVEEVARKELKWAKNGETVVVVMPEQTVTLPTNATAVALEVTPDAQLPSEAWWTLFFGEVPTVQAEQP